MAAPEASETTLGRVRALLAQADHPNTSAVEADAFRTKAEALMFKYRIDLATVGMAQPATTFVPGWKTVQLCDYSSQYADSYRAIAATLVQHCDLRGMSRMIWNGDNPGLNLEIVGYPADLAYFELLYTSCVLAFSTKLEPKYNSGQSIEENVYAMRSAGMERGRIARMIWPDKFEGKPRNYVDKPMNKKISDIFAREATKRGEDSNVLLGRGNNVKTYRASYAEAFVDEIWSRLYRMRHARSQDTTSLVLADVKKRVDEAFYERYPSLRPAPAGTPGTTWVNTRDKCEKCKIAKSGYCREHNYLRPKAYRDRPYSSAGAARGARAAESVDLGGGKPRMSSQNDRTAVEG